MVLVLGLAVVRGSAQSSETPPGTPPTHFRNLQITVRMRTVLLKYPRSAHKSLVALPCKNLLVPNISRLRAAVGPLAWKDDLIASLLPTITFSETTTLTQLSPSLSQMNNVSPKPESNGSESPPLSRVVRSPHHFSLQLLPLTPNDFLF